MHRTDNTLLFFMDENRYAIGHLDPNQYAGLFRNDGIADLRIPGGLKQDDLVGMLLDRKIDILFLDPEYPGYPIQIGPGVFACKKCRNSALKYRGENKSAQELFSLQRCKRSGKLLYDVRCDHRMHALC